MDRKSQQIAKVIRQEEIYKDIYSLYVELPETEPISSGQFFMLYVKDSAHILGRPISVCEYDNKNSVVRFLYQKKGSGTEEFSKLKSSDSIRIMGPLGNGFKLLDSISILVGGGMGVAPLLSLAKESPEGTVAVLGYRDESFLIEEYKKTGCKVIVASDSGKVGVHGTVVDALRQNSINKGTIYSCGPIPMLKAVLDYANETKLDAYLSLEERMACGIGACLGCVTPSVEANLHYNVKKLCVCKDGPVFNAKEIIL